MWTLADRIRALRLELGEWRAELQTQLRTLQEVKNYVGVLLAMERLCSKLLEQLYRAAKCQLPSDRRLHTWIIDAQKNRQLLPDEIASYLHTIRTLHSKADHDLQKITLTPEDAENALSLFLRILQWFYCDCPHGPKLPTIYELPSHQMHFRKAFVTPPRAPNFVDRETELRQLEDWFDQEGSPIFVIGAIGGQGKTYLAAKFLERLKLAERDVQIRWVECNENLKVEELLRDFASEMQGRDIGKARIVRSDELLSIRLDALVQYLEHTPNRWLLILDDFHKLRDDKAKWSEFVRFIDQRCLRTKLLIVTRRDPDVLDEPKLPTGAHGELRLAELPEEMAQEYLALLGLSVDDGMAKKIWEKCSGSPLAMKLFAQAAKRRSIKTVLSLPLPEWSVNAKAWLDELQRDLSDEAKEALKRFIVLELAEIDGINWELLLAAGATEEGLSELQRIYFLEFDDEGEAILHDLLLDYWIGKAVWEGIKEMGEEFVASLRQRLQQGEKLTCKDAFYEIIATGRSKFNLWLLSAAE